MQRMLLLLSVFALSAILAGQTNIPAGTIIPVMLDSKLDAKSCKPGQKVVVQVAQDVPLQNGKLKTGTRVEGEILEVTPAGSSQPASIALRFDKIALGQQMIQLSTNLRALASPLEVEQAQTDVSEDDRGSEPAWSQTTTLIGGDVSYREPGEVYYGLEKVGSSVYAGSWGVLSRVEAVPETKCRGSVAGNDNPQALWVFSHNACGVYGYDAVITHAGRTNPESKIVVASTDGDLKIRSGSGMLLRVNGGEQRSTGESATN